MLALQNCTALCFDAGSMLLTGLTAFRIMIYSFGLGEPLMLKLVVPAFSILLASSVPVPAQQTGVCLPALAVSEFIALMKDGEEPSNAFNRSMKQNFDGTERCAEKINAEFKKFDMPSPFE